MAKPKYERTLVIGYPDYEVDTLGNVCRITPWHYKDVPLPYLLTSRLVRGYPTINLRDRKGNRKALKVHNIVLTAFGGERKKNEVCRHLDGDPTNNKFSNLEWGTHKENWRDRKLHGRGDSHNRTLTLDQVKFIRDSSTILSQHELATICGVSKSCIKHVQKGRTYKNV